VPRRDELGNDPRAIVEFHDERHDRIWEVSGSGIGNRCGGKSREARAGGPSSLYVE
jgi:hypothetical protein